mgnify:CR=1 FL=1
MGRRLPKTPYRQRAVYIDVLRTSRLARKTRITVADLEGMRLRVLRHGNDAMDSLRIDLLADGGVDVIDVDSFDFALFNDAEEKGDAVLTCGAWSGVHPAFVGVPFLCGARCRSSCTTRSSPPSKYKNSSTPWPNSSSSLHKTRPWPNGQGLTNLYSVLNNGLIARRRVPRGGGVSSSVLKHSRFAAKLRVERYVREAGGRLLA